jgi:transcriptional regulator with GAF, ATPase, and Fis domain
LRAAAGPRFARKRIDKLAPLYPLSAEPEAGSLARVIAGKRVAEVPDTEAPGVNPRVGKIARAGKFRWMLSVPLLREDEGIGAISLSHPQPRFALSEGQRALLQAFANWAAIAIENAQLLKELQARNASLAEALGQRTATAEVLRVISTSPRLQMSRKSRIVPQWNCCCPGRSTSASLRGTLRCIWPLACS